MLVIVDAFRDRLLGFLVVQTGDRDLAEDIAQEVFLQAWSQRRAIRGERQLKAWLFTVAARMAWKRSARSQPSEEIAMSNEDLQELTRESQEPEGPRLHAIRQLHQALQEAIRQLSATEQELVTLRYFGELSIREISEALAMPMGSVGVKLGRAIARLRGHLEGRGLRPEDFLP